MTKKDFKLIAAVIAHYTGDFDDDERIIALARNMADALAGTNPRFDRAKFLKACGVSE